jgi:hypothetical protein
MLFLHLGAGLALLGRISRGWRLFFDMCAVFLDDALADAHYNGFSNGILWPLFHYVPLETHSVFDPKLWESYQAANVAFANVRKTKLAILLLFFPLSKCSRALNYSHG